MKKIWYKWSELKTTFWFIPVIMIIISILLAIGLVYVDGLIIFSQDSFSRFFLVKSSNSARSILSTIAAAMIGVAGTVFSVTLVALTLASSQLGPRLIKNFMYIRLNQVVLGSYISTYLYCLLVLNSVKDGDNYFFIPSISILVAIIAALVNIVLLVIFIHETAISIQADHVISDVSAFIAKHVKTLFPEKMESNESEENVDMASAILGYQNRISIKSPRNGYLQYIDSETLLNLITKNDALLELYYRPGDHLVEGVEVGLLYSNGNTEKSVFEKILNQFVIGKTKTSRQDIEYSIDQMVEIAVRALSPGVNDPYTAITCIDNLTSTMSYLAQTKFPSKYRFDEEKNLRIAASTFDFKGVLDTAFNQIRQMSGGNAAVIIRLMEALTTVHGFVKKEKDKMQVIKHAEMVLRIGKHTIDEQNDIQDLINRSKNILQ
jgi:uncharacterized membrane protein